MQFHSHKMSCGDEARDEDYQGQDRHEKHHHHGPECGHGAACDHDHGDLERGEEDSLLPFIDTHKVWFLFIFLFLVDIVRFVA